MIIAQAPGKMIILGEYAVLEGAPSLVYAVNRLAEVRAIRLPGSEFSVSSPSLQISEQKFVLTPSGEIRFDPRIDSRITNRLTFFCSLFENIFNGLKKDSASSALALELMTNAFYSNELHTKLGFGSSAALAVALTKSMAVALKSNLSEADLFRLALFAHREAQGGKGSGIDIAASYYGAVQKYIMAKDIKSQQEPQAVHPWSDLPMAVIWSGASASTTKMVQKVSVLKDKHPAQYDGLINELQNISEAGIEAYEKQDMQSFLQLINQFYAAMKKLGDESRTPIISEVHQQIAEFIQGYPAAYKPSGAGGGDIGILFAADTKVLEELKIKIRQNGFKIVDVDLWTQGVRVQ